MRIKTSRANRHRRSRDFGSAEPLAPISLTNDLILGMDRHSMTYIHSSYNNSSSRKPPDPIRIICNAATFDENPIRRIYQPGRYLESVGH